MPVVDNLAAWRQIFASVQKYFSRPLVLGRDGAAALAVEAVFTEMEKHQVAGAGVFLTLTEPTKPMVSEAASAGLHEEPGFAPVPRLQNVTVEHATQLRGRAVQLPARRDEAFKRATREGAPHRRGALDL